MSRSFPVRTSLRQIAHVRWKLRCQWEIRGVSKEGHFRRVSRAHHRHIRGWGGERESGVHAPGAEMCRCMQSYDQRTWALDFHHVGISFMCESPCSAFQVGAPSPSGCSQNWYEKVGEGSSRLEHTHPPFLWLRIFPEGSSGRPLSVQHLSLVLRICKYPPQMIIHLPLYPLWLLSFSSP